MDKDKIEYKAFPIILSKESIEGRTVTGITAVFGNIDEGGDILHKGAFKKTIKESSKRVKHLWQHDSWMPPIAAIKELKEVPTSKLPEQVLEVFPEAKGGLQVTREYLETSRGDEVLAGIKSGAINEMSFGFNPVKITFDEIDGRTIRNLKEVALWDTSDVNWGMNPATAAAKSALGFKMGKLTDYLAAAIQELEGITDEEIFENIKKALQDKEPDAVINQLKQLEELLLVKPESDDPLTPWALLADMDILQTELADYIEV